MPKKHKKPRVPTYLEAWKSIRKEPVPPGNVHKSKDRELDEERVKREISDWQGWRGEDYEEYEAEE